ncbi:MAG: YHYH protein, partial [Bacteroidota bacterium]
MIRSTFKLWIFIILPAVILISCGDDDEDDCVQITWYEDADGDGLGNPDVSLTACEQPAGFVDNSGDTEDCTTSTFYQDA